MPTLYVENDIKLGWAIQEVATARGYPPIRVCLTLTEARRSLLEDEYDRIILDVALLDGVGTDLLPDLADAGFRGEIIVVSGVIRKDWMKEVLATALACGLSIRFLEKVGDWVEEAFA